MLESSTRRTTISEKTNGMKSIGTRLLKIFTTEQQANRKSRENNADLIETVKTFYLERVDYKRKCDAAERAYEAQREKDLAIKKCEGMRFLMIDTSNLPPHKRAFFERQQAEIIRIYQDAGADDAGADD
ncbi:hypothetical protein Tco_0588114 [Tanacetum coccineum]